MKPYAALILLGTLAFAPLFSPSKAFGNGSAWRTGVPTTGNPAAAFKEARQTEITIEEEDLVIDLHQDFAAVEVRYRMRNTGGKTKQEFFFPVERWDVDLKEYTPTADGKALEWADVEGTAKPPSDLKVVPDWGLGPKIKWWKKSVIPFAKNQVREVVVRYKAHYAQESSSVSDNIDNGPEVFDYSLSPAATWHGPIAKGKVTINILHPEPGDVTITKPKDRFSKINETRYEWNFHDLKPTLDDDIKIKAHSSYGDFVAFEGDVRKGSYIFRGKEYFFTHCNYEATASSTLKPEGEHVYDVANIKGSNLTGTWAEGVEGDGIGESISLKVKRPLPLDAILISPGYAKRSDYWEKRDPVQESWWQNNRVAQLEITLNGEHTFTTAIPDENFRDLYPIPVRGYSKPVKTIQLVIKGVHRGSHYQDTCISMVSLRAKLSKEPKIGPIR